MDPHINGLFGSDPVTQYAMSNFDKKLPSVPMSKKKCLEMHSK